MRTRARGSRRDRQIEPRSFEAVLSTTAIYAQVATTDLAKVLTKAHPREKTYNRRRIEHQAEFIERWHEYFGR